MSEFRPSLTLDGTWSFTTDPDERGEADAWYQRTSGFGREVAVPAAWQSYGRDLQDYTGVAWYYRCLRVPPEWQGQSVALVFGASDYLTRVWLNGVFLGEHEGGFTPFEFVLGEGFEWDNESHLVVRVYDPQDCSEVPHGAQGAHFSRVSGLWQSVHLEARQATHLAMVTHRAHTDPDSIETHMVLNTPANNLAVTVEICDASGILVAEIDSVPIDFETHCRIDIPACKRWHPDDPHLYSVGVKLITLPEGGVVDQIVKRIGVRSVEAIDGRLLLNGQPLSLRGTIDCGYWPETLYNPPDNDEIQRELRLAKEAGFNLIRKHGKIEDPRWLDCCDRIGMLVWSEMPACDRWTSQARRRFRQQMLAVMQRDMHRPSIIAWSLYHARRGLDGAGEHLQPWLRQLYSEAHAVDPTRPVCTHAGGSSMRTDLLDEHHRYVLPEESRQWTHSLNGDVPAAGAPRLVSEFGLWGLPAMGERWFSSSSESPAWMFSAGLAHQNEAKWPHRAEVNFERYKLAAVFEDLDNLAKLTQRRLVRGIKGLIEDLRRRSAFAGYVCKTFSDTEWEATGCIDHLRRPKLGFEEWTTFNGPIALIAEFDARNLWAQDSVTAKIYVSNHTRHALKGTLCWGLDGFDCDGEFEIEVAPFASAQVGAVPFDVPLPSRPVATRFVVRLLSAGWEVASNHFELTLTPRDATLVPEQTIACGEVRDELRSRLALAGFQIESEWRPGLTMLTESLNEDVTAALDRGAHVILLAEWGPRNAEMGFLSFRELPPLDTWERCASFHYIQWDLFPQLPLNTIMGWEMQDLYPHYVLPMGTYTAGGRALISNQSSTDPANVLAGYFEGWLGNFGASVLLQSQRRGKVLTTTLRLGTQYGVQPIGTLLLNRLLTENRLFEARTVYELET